MEWPPKSGKIQEFPAVDRAAWYSLGEAKFKIHAGQVPIIEQFEEILGLQPASPESGDEARGQRSLF